LFYDFLSECKHASHVSPFVLVQFAGPLVSRLCPMVNGSSNCCTTQMENQLKSLVKKELQDVLKQNAHSIQAVLNANSAEYLGTFATLFVLQKLLKFIYKKC
jgi:Glypican